MQYMKLMAVVFAGIALVACGKGGDSAAGGDKSASASGGVCELVSTKDNSPLVIKATDADTPQAKEFLSTCVNPYTKAFLADPEAVKAGRKVYTFNNCMGCHGGKSCRARLRRWR